ncbi:DUF3322 domain-containing protein [Thioalkalivibrio sp.]|uniref:DUF3322 domain-containing protein n=1 Tax=Thioalkalivibrio sp. TaxID=2093813 RepID=UPI0012D516BB|nr:DUF3322 domain-containing protein [Thioalkalivibrio sp.]TVP81696.1 MAG: hypothetical protein EA346_04475 [Thioalkalivibrio sp.]
MTWTRPEDLRAQVRRLWDRGDLLAALVSDQEIFPRKLVLKGPTSSEMAGRFDEVRVWIAALREMPWCRIEWREFTHRIFGANRVPREVWVDRLDDALAWIGKQREAARFRRLVDLTRMRQPVLLEWLGRRPMRALELAGDWERLLDIVDWLREHPRPGIYLRQVDIPGVHSKFIEAHRGVLIEWLDRVLPVEVVDAAFTGVSRFTARYGFRDKPARIRFRALDEALPVFSNVRNGPEVPGLPDVTLDADSFAALSLPVQWVFITENETNFLAFPPVPRGLVIFGAGYGWETLGGIEWLQRCRLHYWGDIDTHGFAILDQLRNRFRHVDSLLMDRATLMAHEAHWGREPDPVRHDLTRLTAVERALYDDLRDNRLRESLRLEQERIGFRWVKAALRQRLT